MRGTDRFLQVTSDKSALALTSEDMLPYLMASLPPDMVIAAGYDISELLMRCTYNGVKCQYR